MQTITAETYTTANGSNMDSIEYKANATLEEIITDLRGFDNWDYAILSDDDGETIATVYRDGAIVDDAHDDVVSITEAADMLDVSRQRVHAMLQSGKLEGRKVGNTWSVYRDSVENRIESQRELFQMCQLEAYLGEYADDFDIDAIVEDATVVDYRTGNRYWRDDIDLNEIAQRHDISGK